MEIDQILEQRINARNSNIPKVYSRVLSPTRSCEAVVTTFLNPIPDERLNISAPFAYNAQLTTVRSTPFLSSNLCGINFSPLSGAPAVLAASATNSFVVGFFGQGGLDRRELPKPDEAGEKGALYPMPITSDSGANAGLAWQFTVPSLSVRTESPVHGNYCGAELPSTSLTFSYSGSGITVRSATLNLEIQHGANQSTPGVNASTREYLERRLDSLNRYIENYRNQTEPKEHDTATGTVQPTYDVQQSQEEEEARQEKLRQLEEERQRIEEQIHAAEENVDEHQQILKDYVQCAKSAWGSFSVPPPQTISSSPPDFDFSMTATTNLNLEFDQQSSLQFSSIPSLVCNKLNESGMAGTTKVPFLQQVTKFVSGLTGFQVPTDINSAMSQGLTLLNGNGQGQRLQINNLAQLGSAVPLALSKDLLEQLNLPADVKKIMGVLLPMLKDPTAFLQNPGMLLESFLTAFNIQGADTLIQAVGRFIQTPNLDALLNVGLLTVSQELLGPLGAIYEAYQFMTGLMGDHATQQLRSLQSSSVPLTTATTQYNAMPQTAYEALQRPLQPMPETMSVVLPTVRTSPVTTTSPPSVQITPELYMVPTSDVVPSFSQIVPPVPPVYSPPDIFEVDAPESAIPQFVSTIPVQPTPMVPLELESSGVVSSSGVGQPVSSVVLEQVRQRVSLFSLGVCPGVATEWVTILERLRHQIQSDPEQVLNHLLVNYFFVHEFDLYNAVINYGLLVEWVEYESNESAAYLRSLINGDILGFFEQLIKVSSGIDLEQFPQQRQELKQLLSGYYQLGVDANVLY